MTIRVAWAPSTDPNIASYVVQRSADKITWSADLATIVHNLAGAAYDTARSLFFWDDSIGSTSTWYRLKAIDSLAQESSWSPPFRAELTCDESELRLCNQALSRIGVTRKLTTYETDPSAEGIECRLWYPAVLRELQALFRWPWAIRRDALFLTASTSSEYRYVYQAPDDCLQPLRLVVETDPNSSWENRQPFLVEGDSTATTLILTDLEDAELVYVALVENVCYFPPPFKRALYLGVASRLAAALKKDEQLARALAEESSAAIRVAMSLAANTGQPEVPSISSFEAARR